jgi:hypothetical protein
MVHLAGVKHAVAAAWPTNAAPCPSTFCTRPRKACRPSGAGAGRSAGRGRLLQDRDAVALTVLVIAISLSVMPAGQRLSRRRPSRPIVRVVRIPRVGPRCALRCVFLVLGASWWHSGRWPPLRRRGLTAPPTAVGVGVASSRWCRRFAGETVGKSPSRASYRPYHGTPAPALLDRLIPLVGRRNVASASPDGSSFGWRGRCAGAARPWARKFRSRSRHHRSRCRFRRFRSPPLPPRPRPRPPRRRRDGRRSTTDASARPSPSTSGASVGASSAPCVGRGCLGCRCGLGRSGASVTARLGRCSARSFGRRWPRRAANFTVSSPSGSPHLAPTRLRRRVVELSVSVRVGASDGSAALAAGWFLMHGASLPRVARGVGNVCLSAPPVEDRWRVLRVTRAAGTRAPGNVRIAPVRSSFRRRDA